MSHDRPSRSPAPVPFREALRFWLKLGFISFGGPTGQIAILHEEVVERRRWVSEGRFLHALNFCMLLPGPEAQQLVTYVGWLLHRTRGAIAAGSLFILPSVLILLALSWVYLRFGSVGWVSAALAGLRPAVVAIVAAALVRIASRTLRHPARVAIACGAFLALHWAHADFPLVIVIAAAIGSIGAQLGWSTFHAPFHDSESGRIEGDPASDLPSPTLRRFLRVFAIFFAAWVIPVVGLALARGTSDVLFREAIFFTKTAMVTFGGAYAVLPYVAERAVHDFGWLSATQMIDGLGLAESTPGPLIMVLQFVGYLAGAGHASDLGLGGAVLGALVASYFTFLPSFAWILLAAPSIERLRDNRRIGGAMVAVTSAVVGVVASLAVWFGGQVLWMPGTGWRGLDFGAALIAGAAYVGLTKWKWGVPWVVGGACILAVIRRAAGV